MNTTSRDFEIALSSNNYMNHVFKGIFLKRHWYAYPCMFFIINILFNYFGLFDDYDFSFHLMRYLTFPFIVYLVMGLILGVIERRILFGFESSTKDEKIRKAKLFFFITHTMNWIAFILALNYNKFIIPNFFSYDMLEVFYINIPIALIMSIIITLIFRPFIKELPKIEEKGILTEKIS